MKIGSLFSGIGGIDLAFQQAGFEIAFANEIDKYACATYRHNFPDCNLFECDIRNLNVSQLSEIDVLTAGFPCQPFSVCGNQKGFKDNRGNIFFEIMRVADILKPKVIFLENVANLIKHNKGKTFNVIHNELVSRGYIIRYLLADACDYGIPQHRTRVYIMAFQEEKQSSEFSFPEPVPLKRHIFDIIDKTVKADNSYYIDVNSKNYTRLNNFIKDDNQIYRFSDYGIQVSKDCVSFTLKANMGTWYNRIPYIKDVFGIRTITPEECLKLQGFPDGFEFPDSIPINEKYKQAGNTVIVPLIYQLAKQIMINIK